MGTRTKPIKMDSYVRLVRKFPLIPIENDKQLDAATAVIDELLDKDRSREEEAYLDVLGQLIEAYEEEAHPIEPATDAQLLADILESRGLTQVAFAKLTGIAESTVSAVLHGSRRLTREQIGKIGKHLSVPPEAFAHSG